MRNSFHNLHDGSVERTKSSALRCTRTGTRFVDACSLLADSARKLSLHWLVRKPWHAPVPTAAAFVIVEQAGGDIAADERRQAHAGTVSCQTIGDSVATLANLEAEIPAEIMPGETYYLSHISTQPHR